MTWYLRWNDREDTCAWSTNSTRCELYERADLDGQVDNLRQVIVSLGRVVNVVMTDIEFNVKQSNQDCSDLAEANSTPNIAEIQAPTALSPSGLRKSPLDGVDSRPATCANVRLQAGARQTIAIGASRTHGFGAFATTLIRRGDFLSEYPGELISNDEAERRGQVYDRVSTSYLFDLNEDAVVDAIRMGNKTRFINHDPSHPNCNAKVVRVGPEHRITIWVKRDIRPGEELFFDYGFKPECAPEWSRVQPSLETDHRGTDQ